MFQTSFKPHLNPAAAGAFAATGRLFAELP